jgi:hypothetical protein
LLLLYYNSKIQYTLVTRFNKKSETKNTKNPNKRKASNIMIEMISNKNNKVQVENLESSSINPINEGNIKLEERKLALLERQVKLRKEAAEAIELKNNQLKMSLGLTNL